MAHVDIAGERLRNQHIARPRRGAAADLVAALGAVQAQEYAFAKWALALRLAAKPTDAGIEAAIDAGDILRTHALRPTWHFVAPSDIVWIQQLTAPRVHARLATYLPRLGVEKRVLPKAAAVIERALGGGRHLTRSELQSRLARAGIAHKGTALALVIMFAELEALICSGPRRGKQFTYALVSERAPGARALPRDEALAGLTRRYFASHGPATIRDFVWWSSLTTADARRGLEIIGARSFAEGALTYWTVGAARRAALSRGTDVRLLPVYDEFLVAYRDRTAVPHGPGGYSLGPLKHALLIDGQVAGTWAMDRAGDVRVTPARKLTPVEQRGVEEEGERFRRFLGVPSPKRPPSASSAPRSEPR
jgi:hypothetical protein